MHNKTYRGYMVKVYIEADDISCLLGEVELNKRAIDDMFNLVTQIWGISIDGEDINGDTLVGEFAMNKTNGAYFRIYQL